jgi:hypothetical protein
MNQRAQELHLGGFGEIQSVPQGRAARPEDVVLSRARID